MRGAATRAAHQVAGAAAGDDRERLDGGVLAAVRPWDADDRRRQRARAERGCRARRQPSVARVRPSRRRPPRRRPSARRRARTRPPGRIPPATSTLPSARIRPSRTRPASVPSQRRSAPERAVGIIAQRADARSCSEALDRGPVLGEPRGSGSASASVDARRRGSSALRDELLDRHLRRQRRLLGELAALRWPTRSIASRANRCLLATPWRERSSPGGQCEVEDVVGAGAPCESWRSRTPAT
jgi:hypothetical protein